MTFPKDFPLSPPELKFESAMWHPSVYEDGRVCISILHPPGDDPMNPFESSAERWLPVHTVESIVSRPCARRVGSSGRTQLVSVISLLAANPPSIESPANVDAAKQVRDSLADYRKKVRVGYMFVQVRKANVMAQRLARKSAEDAYES
jgi:ubiquitin-conjugating enzyme E2 G1